MEDQPVNLLLRRTHIKKFRSRKLFSKINRSTHICDTYLRKGNFFLQKMEDQPVNRLYDLHTLNIFDLKHCFQDQPINHYLHHIPKKRKKDPQKMDDQQLN